MCRSTARALLATLALLLLSGCTLLSFVEDRLPPPEANADGILFRYQAPAARQVNVAGEFNNWLGTANGGRLDPNLDAMRDTDGDGVWELALPLPPGRYQYKFLVDQVDWQEDPANPESADDGFGGQNSILVVQPNLPYDYDESYISTSLGTGARMGRKLSHTFRLEGYPDAGEVHVTGDFSDWDPEAYRMERDDGAWVAEVELGAGRYVYKYVVDGEWIVDPGNPVTEDDGYGGTNSVLSLQPGG